MLGQRWYDNLNYMQVINCKICFTAYKITHNYIEEPAEACHQQIFQKFGGPVHAAIDFVGMTSTVERTLGALAFVSTEMTMSCE